MSNQLNLDVDAALACRARHRVVRAMHDGACPNCGVVVPSEEMQQTQRVYGFKARVVVKWQCPRCQFSVSAKEAEAVMREFQQYMQPAVQEFLRWREERAKDQSDARTSE